MATSRMADQVGRVLGGRYRLVTPIGTGGSADVYLADDVTLRRRVAVKVLHAALASDERFLRRFRAEAQAVAALRHPNIMSVYDWGEDDDGPYLVLEHLGGGSLRDLLDRGHLLTPAQALAVGLEAARGLDYAHRRGFVHRDIKPANLVFDDEGRLCIADFGLARALAEAALTEPTGAVLGTARYASPEQASGSSVDGKSDVYSLALVLVEAVTGDVPFAADTSLATLMARVDQPIVVPDGLGPLVPVLTRAGAVDPDERPDAGALARALDATARDLERPDPLPLPGTATVDLGVGPHDDLTALPPTRRAPYDIEADDDGVIDGDRRGVRRRRRWPLVAAVLVVVLALLAGGAYAVTQATVPTHPVPRLHELSVDAARQEVADERFRIEVVRQEFSERFADGQIIDQDPSSGRLKEGRPIRVVVSRGPEPRAVPDLSGLDEVAADAALRDKGFVVKLQPRHDEQAPKGAVLEWHPDDGAAHPKGTEVTVVVSAGKAPRQVPAFADRAYEQYRRQLDELGLVARKVEEFSDTVEKGRVISTQPAPGQQAPAGSEVVVTVSKGPETVAVPNVIGREFDEARQVLEEAGLQAGGPFGPPKGRRVFASDPQPGTRVRPGSVVDLYVR